MCSVKYIVAKAAWYYFRRTIIKLGIVLSIIKSDSYII